MTSPGDFTPDGTEIVFVRASYPPGSVGQLWMARVDGTNTRKLVDTLIGYRVSLTRDGTRIAGSLNGQLVILDLQNISAPPRQIAIPKAQCGHPTLVAGWDAARLRARPERRDTPGPRRERGWH